VILATLSRLGLGRALLQRQRLLDQHGGRWALGNEGERPILIDGDHHRDHGAGVGLRLGVERLDEFHDVDAVLTQRRANRRGRAGLSTDRLQLDFRQNLFAICVSPQAPG